MTRGRRIFNKAIIIHSPPNLTTDILALHTLTLRCYCRYIQYDDWWYVIKGPGYGATVRWEPISTVFPHGLKYSLYHYLLQSLVLFVQVTSFDYELSILNLLRFPFIFYLTGIFMIKYSCQLSLITDIGRFVYQL